MSKINILERLRKILNRKNPELSEIINSLNSVDEFKEFCEKNISDESFAQIEFEVGMSYVFDECRVKE